LCSGAPETLAARIVAFFITWGGVVFFSVILGFVFDAITEKMNALKKGTGCIVESGHTLIVGWAPFASTFILEICDANSSEGGGTIVVLTEQPKEAVEQQFYAAISKDKLCGSKVVFRTGSGLNQVDLEKVAASLARAILILAPDDGDPDRKDAVTLRKVLTTKCMSLSGHIIAELADVDNEALIKLVGGDDIETVVSHDIIGRLLLMSARTPGLAKIYGEILGFAGDEFYMQEWEQLEGVKFGDLATRMQDAIVLGIKKTVTNKHGNLEQVVELVPDMGRELQAGEEVIVLAEDDDTYAPGLDCCDLLDIGESPDYVAPVGAVEDILVIGWRRDIRDMFNLLDHMVYPGSKLHLFADVPLDSRDRLLLESGFNPATLKNFTIVHHEGNPSNRKSINLLPVELYSSAMILADENNEMSTAQSDSQTLACLLLLRDVQRTRKSTAAAASFMEVAQPVCLGGPERNSDSLKTVPVPGKNKDFDEEFAVCRIICEILDMRTQKTVATNSFFKYTSDFIQTNQMMSQSLAMVAENRTVARILAELLGADGSNLVLNKSSRYLKKGEENCFMAIAKRAQKYDEVILGYKGSASGDALCQSGSDMNMNPKDKMVMKVWDHVEFVVLERGSAEPRKPRDSEDENTMMLLASVSGKVDEGYTKRFVVLWSLG
jgi:hypothetical protein